MEETTKAMQHHTASLQQPENSGIQVNTKCLESILVTPTASYGKQVEENKHILNVQKLSNWIIMSKSTEDTVMELDAEGATNYEQLQDLIWKECKKRDHKYARLEDKYNKLEQQVTQKDQQKNDTEGPTIKQQRDRRLEEKQITQKATCKPTKRPPKKRTHQQPRSTKPTKLQKQRMSRRKNSGSRLKDENKHLSPLQNKSNRNPPNTTGKKKPPRKQQPKI